MAECAILSDTHTCVRACVHALHLMIEMHCALYYIILLFTFIHFAHKNHHIVYVLFDIIVPIVPYFYFIVFKCENMSQWVNFIYCPSQVLMMMMYNMMMMYIII